MAVIDNSGLYAMTDALNRAEELATMIIKEVQIIRDNADYDTDCKGIAADVRHLANVRLAGALEALKCQKP